MNFKKWWENRPLFIGYIDGPFGMHWKPIFRYVGNGWNMYEFFWLRFYVRWIR